LLLLAQIADYRIRNNARAEESRAHALLKRMLENGIHVITFDLREPSLHELFVEKCGGEEVEKNEA
ncbi:MAG: hypothetical protein K2N29_04485, partial [Ruminiclostridium sp.]|nr:hypothetical protein [Ruminiclostridium sp.]